MTERETIWIGRVKHEGRTRRTEYASDRYLAQSETVDHVMTDGTPRWEDDKTEADPE